MSVYDDVMNQGQIAIQRFKEKSGDYPPEGFQFLGAKGQFSDIARKVFKLKKAIWEGKPLKGEQPHEVVQDLMGHCMLLLYLLEQEEFEDMGEDEDKPWTEGPGHPLQPFRREDGFAS